MLIALGACQTAGGSGQKVASTSACTTPLPENVEIAQPTDTVPPQLAKFAGTWGHGKWDGKLCHTLVVQRVTSAGNVRAIYSWENYSGWNAHEGNSQHVGSIADGKLTLERFDNGADVTYWFEGDTLMGSYVNASGARSIITLSKLE